MTEPLVGVVMGSNSDWEVMRHAAAQLAALHSRFISGGQSGALLRHGAGTHLPVQCRARDTHVITN